MSDPFTSGPIAPERNPPINAQYYAPDRFIISAIVPGSNTVITTTTPNNFVVGQLVRLLIPWYWGAQQINTQLGYISLLISSSQFILDIYSIGIKPFALSTFAPAIQNQPQVIPVGDANSGPINTGRTNNQTFISGSFINISPN